jgi:hypothetical protein
MAEPEIVAFRQFVDGSMRPVYDNGRRHYVIDDEGDRVYGVWFIPRDEAKIEEKPDPADDYLHRGRCAAE